jgi:hypothetical protein
MKRIVNSSGIKPRCEVQGFFSLSDVPDNVYPLGSE